MFFRSQVRYEPTFGTVLSHAVLGACAGVAATWVMGRVTTFLYAREGSDVRERERRARGAESTTEVLADRIAAWTDRYPLTRAERAQWSKALHWGTGASMGALYGTWYGLNPNAGLGRGLLYGTGMFLLVDELANAAMGLSPREFPWQAHARGLAGHLVFGAATDATLRLFERPALGVVGLSEHVAQPS